MPLYEYRCEEDGTVIELLRSSADADKPVTDPDAKGRVFKRQHSTFATGAGNGSAGMDRRSESLPMCCPCGKMPGSCNS